MQVVQYWLNQLSSLGKNILRIGVDLMGSDTSPQVLFEAVLQAVELLEGSDQFVVFLTKEIQETLNKSNPQIEFKLVTDLISMSDDPLYSVRHKKKSSILTAIKELKKNRLSAFISAGNTGALIAAAILYLPKFAGIQRPALLALLPTQKGPVAVIDVGGNISCKAKHLVQFAKMGAAFQSCHLDIESPRIGLLNVGAESKKGTLEIREAYQLLKETSGSKWQFIGNIEGRDVFDGKVDVLVTSGVSGNVLLKTAEGVASFIFESLEDYPGLLSEEGKKSIHTLHKQFHYAEYPGAIIAGVDGIVIKCHGHATAPAMYNSIKGSITLCKKDFLNQIKERLN